MNKLDISYYFKRTHKHIYDKNNSHTMQIINIVYYRVNIFFLIFKQKGIIN